MIEIKIQDKKYEIPTEWKDITLNYWCGLYQTHYFILLLVF